MSDERDEEARELAEALDAGTELYRDRLLSRLRDLNQALADFGCRSSLTVEEASDMPTRELEGYVVALRRQVVLLREGT